MPLITESNYLNAVPKLVASSILMHLKGNARMGSIVNRDYDGTMAKSGDTVNVPLPPVMVANALARGGSVQRQNPNIGNVQILIDKHVEASGEIPDVSRAFAEPDVMDAYTKAAAIAIMEKQEDDLFGLYAGLTANAAIGTAATPITEALIDSAETVLFDQKLPTSQEKFLAVSSATYSQIRQIARFSEADKIGAPAGESALIGGDVMRIKGFTVFRSQFVKKTGGGPVTTHNLAFAKDALCLVSRRLPVAMPGTGVIQAVESMDGYVIRVTFSYNQETLSPQFTVDALYGVGVLRGTFGQVVRT